MQLIKKIPIPIGGVALGIATLGNVVGDYSNILRITCGIIAIIIIGLLFLHIVTDWSAFLEDMKQPAMAVVFPTFDMALMVLSTYLNPYNHIFAVILWSIAIIIHISVIILVTKRFLLTMPWSELTAAYFITYVGIVVGSVTIAVPGLIFPGQILFWFGFIFLLILTPFVLKRVFKGKKLPPPLVPTNGIIAAPASLCLAGYLSTFPEPNIILVGFLVVYSFVMTFIGVCFFLRCVTKKFFPSFSSGTFPFVISALAMKKAYVFSTIQVEAVAPVLNVIFWIELILAFALCIIILFRYCLFLFTQPVNNK